MIVGSIASFRYQGKPPCRVGREPPVRLAREDGARWTVMERCWCGWGVTGWSSADGGGLRSAMLGLPAVTLEYAGHLQSVDAACMRASVEISFGKPATTNSGAECSPSRLLLTATIR
jgi:hypothetical protein